MAVIDQELTWLMAMKPFRLGRKPFGKSLPSWGGSLILDMKPSVSVVNLYGHNLSTLTFIASTNPPCCLPGNHQYNSLFTFTNMTVNLENTTLTFNLYNRDLYPPERNLMPPAAFAWKDSFLTFCALVMTLKPNSRSSRAVATVKSSPNADTLLPWSSSHSTRW